MIARTCTTCQTPLSRRATLMARQGKPTTGLCGVCWRNSVRAPVLTCCDCGKTLANRKAKRCHPCVNRLMAQDEAREARRLELTRAARQRPEIAERHRRGCQALARRKMAWLPDDRRAEYFRILKCVGRAELAKAIIRERMTPFERQLSRVMSGEVRVVAKVPMPRPSYDFTIGGVSAGIAA